MNSFSFFVNFFNFLSTFININQQLNYESPGIQWMNSFPSFVSLRHMLTTDFSDIPVYGLIIMNPGRFDVLFALTRNSLDQSDDMIYRIIKMKYNYFTQYICHVIYIKTWLSIECVIICLHRLVCNRTDDIQN